MGELLLVDDQDRYFELFRRVLPEHRLHGPVRSWAAAQAFLKAHRRVDLVLLDVHFDIPAADLIGGDPGGDAAEISRLRRRQGLFILKALRRDHPDLPVIVMTSREELSLEDAGELGAGEEYTYFLDDEELDARALKAQVEGVLQARRGADTDGPVFWGRSLPMRRLRQRLGVLARGRLPVVLLGPTGTGKSLLARHFVHSRSGRGGQFVAVDLATVPKDLMTAHLFGSVKGAYTGSVADRPGAFEAAHGGTLFLDEIGNLAPDAQKMLLTVLQEGVITRIGATKEQKVDVKLVVATNEDLAERVREGTFRADLYMRLNPTTAVVLPALAERKGDLEPLIEFSVEQALARPHLKELLDEYSRSQGLRADRVGVVFGGPVPEKKEGTVVFLVPERALRLLRQHDWPGNLRELAMVLENAVLLALAELTGVPGERADLVALRPKLLRDLLQPVGLSPSDRDDRDGLHLQVVVKAQPLLNRVATDMERQVFEALYVRENGDFGAMARLLLGDAEHARKVQLRFNQLGLKVKDLRGQIGPAG